jgi:lipopolysaccharide export system permease protein
VKKRLIKTLDLYIIKKFLGTFFFTIALIIGISVIFDLSEKIDDFIESEAPFKAIVFDYYMNFIPYFANLFSGLFTFLAVIFFTSKMAYNSEITAILSSGVSFKRLMVPYMISALAICIFSFSLATYIIPPANKKMTEFQYTYVKKKAINHDRNIHRQLTDSTYMYMMEYVPKDDYGKKFTLERFDGYKLTSKLSADIIRWDRETKKWTISNYIIRDIYGEKEVITSGARIDTTLAILPEEFKTNVTDIETMNQPELIEFIRQQKMRGVDALEPYEIERHRRIAVPFSAFILSLIGASLATRKLRGGIGLHLGFGIGLSFSYIMFQQISKVFALSGAVSPLVSVWIPNLLFAFIAIFIYKWAAR